MVLIILRMLVAKNEKTALELLPALANRHGLITGATGTGKTLTMQALAQRLSDIGVPVFMADVKGDFSGIAKPGGNTTGVASQIIDLASKRLELLKEAVPNLDVVAVLSHLANPAARRGLAETETAARKLKIRVVSFGIGADAREVESVFRAIVQERAGGLIVQPDPVTGKYSERIARLALQNRIPAIGGVRQFAVDGGLMTYGADFVEGWRLAARYVHRILQGARPADLPVEQPTAFELAVNPRTAQTLGVTLPASVLLRAETV